MPRDELLHLAHEPRIARTVLERELQVGELPTRISAHREHVGEHGHRVEVLEWREGLHRAPDGRRQQL